VENRENAGRENREETVKQQFSRKKAMEGGGLVAMITGEAEQKKRRGGGANFPVHRTRCHYGSEKTLR